MAAVSGLPHDILVHIMSFLDPQDLLNVAQVCRSFSRVLQVDGLMIWRSLYFRLANTPDKQMATELESTAHYWRGSCLAYKEQDLPEFFDVAATPDLTLMSPDTMKVSDNVFGLRRQTDDRAVRSDLPFPDPTLAEVRPTILTRAGPNNTITRLHCWISCYYYEVEIVAANRPIPRDCLSVGLATGTFPTQGRQVGWISNSFGYHSDDGHVFHGRGFGSAYGEGFSVGDTVGCGLTMGPQPEIFFTRNGRFCGSMMRLQHFPFDALPLFPTLGVSLGSGVRWNFGERPFAYDLLQRDWETEEPEQSRHLVTLPTRQQMTRRAAARLQQQQQHDQAGDDERKPEVIVWLTISMLLALIRFLV
eukprot:c11411_g1_i2.p1 GENE.c11411_g1_i2~~c11411_g1_i2.p1  ORF type:complete len:361 (-),score=50.28 c11411_g1_i2:816-1898(-)